MLCVTLTLFACIIGPGWMSLWSLLSLCCLLCLCFPCLSAVCCLLDMPCVCFRSLFWSSCLSAVHHLRIYSAAIFYLRYEKCYIVKSHPWLYSQSVSCMSSPILDNKPNFHCITLKVWMQKLMPTKKRMILELFPPKNILVMCLSKQGCVVNLTFVDILFFIPCKHLVFCDVLNFLFTNSADLNLSPR